MTNLLMFVIDECQGILPLSEEQNKQAGDPTIFTLVVRMREWGLCWHTLGQMPSRIARVVIANSYIKIAFIVTDGTDIRCIKDAFSLTDKQAEIIGKLPERTALVKMSGRYLEPFIITFDVMKINKDADEEKIRILMGKELSKMKYIPRIVKTFSNDNESENTVDSNTNIKLSDDENQLLLKIVSDPWLYVTQQYKLVGFSLDKGNKIKNSLCQKGFIILHKIHTGVGGFKLVCEPIEEAYKYFKLENKNPKGSRSFEHQYYQHNIAKYLEKYGNITIEKFQKAYSAQPDVMLKHRRSDANEIIFAIEVELTSARYDETHIVKNIRFCNYIIIACKTKEIQSEANKIIADFDDQYRNKISSCLINEFEKHFENIFKSEVRNNV